MSYIDRRILLSAFLQHDSKCNLPGGYEECARDNWTDMNVHSERDLSFNNYTNYAIVLTQKRLVNERIM